VHVVLYVRGPYKENAPGERAAAAALREDVAWMRKFAAQAVENRDRFAGELRAHGFTPFPSDANFLLVPIANATRVGELMRANGVAVRPYPGLRGIGDTLRITIGPWPMMVRVLEELLAAVKTVSAAAPVAEGSR
jgi:histidinol-phosphate/aromatic aminotransferase/cobyric acid decarboxylase-like protein